MDTLDEPPRTGLSFGDQTIVQGDVIGGSQYNIKFYVLSSTSVDWSQYRQSQQRGQEEPYKFLSYYDTTDADIFYGREIFSDLLVGKISSHKLILINGKSGSGKTSFINAGIIPKLVEKGYFTIVFRDYGYPTDLIKEGMNSLENINIHLTSEQTLTEVLNQVHRQSQRPLAIFFDQFERFFLNLSRHQRNQFTQELGQCLNQINGSEITLIISIRQDFFGNLSEFWEIPEFHTESYSYCLKPLSPTEATDAIEKPLQRLSVKVGYEPDFLAKCLVPNLFQGSEPDQVSQRIEPVHLQIVCNRLFKEVRTCYHQDLVAGKIVLIKQELYDKLGGVPGMLQGYLEEILQEYYAGEKLDQVKSVLKHMVNSRGTREYKSVQEIAENTGLTQKQVEEIIQQLDQSRLVETIAERADAHSKYSITHEYLGKQINHWFTLNELELKRAKELYDRCLENWKISKRNRIPRTQLEYLRKYKSILLKSKPEGQKLFRESEFLYHGLNISVTLGLVLLVATTLAALIGQRNAVINQIQVSRQASEIAFTSKQELESLMEGVRAGRTLNHPILKMLNPKIDLENQVRDSLQNVIDQIKERNRFEPNHGKVTAVALNQDQTHLATGGEDGYVVVWDVKGEKRAEFKAHSTSIRHIIFSPNHKKLATISEGFVHLWDLQGNQLGDEFEIANWIDGDDFNFSSNGDKIVTLDTNGNAYLRDSHGEIIKKLEGHQGDVISFALSPDGKIIATGGNDGTVQLWDIEGNFINQFQAHESNNNQEEYLDNQNSGFLHQDNLNTLSFSPDSQYIATAGGKVITRLWNLEGKKIMELKGTPDNNAEAGGIEKIIFNPNKTQLATWKVRGRAWTGFDIWYFDLEYPNNNNISEFLEGTKLVFHPDGNQFIIDGKLFQYRTAEHLVKPGNEVTDFALSSDGKLIATAEGEIVRLWDLSSTLETDENLMMNPEIETVQKQELDQLIEQSCNWLDDYLKSHPTDQNLCDGVSLLTE